MVSRTGSCRYPTLVPKLCLFPYAAEKDLRLPLLTIAPLFRVEQVGKGDSVALWRKKDTATAAGQGLGRSVMSQRLPMIQEPGRCGPRFL